MRDNPFRPVDTSEHVTFPMEHQIMSCTTELKMIYYFCREPQAQNLAQAFFPSPQLLWIWMNVKKFNCSKYKSNSKCLWSLISQHERALPLDRQIYIGEIHFFKGENAKKYCVQILVCRPNMIRVVMDWNVRKQKTRYDKLISAYRHLTTPRHVKFR
jgi:hypothetical protein